MAFRSDLEARRTWDPDSGWELTAQPAMFVKDGETDNFWLRHPEEGHLWVQGRVASSTPLGPDATGKKRFARVYRVTSMGFYFEDRGRRRKPMPEHKRLFVEALDHFGVFHNGPVGPLEVIFD